MYYPRLIRRIRALLIDSLVILAIFIISLLFAGIFESGNSLLRVAIAFIPAIFYEPLLVSINGATIGHRIMNIQVISVKSRLKLNLIVSLFRSFLKFIFGIPSLYFVLTTKNHQALHDLLSGSLVVIKEEKLLPSYEKLDIRNESTEYKYPSKLRRIAVIFAYFFTTFIALSVSFNFFISTECIQHHRCSSTEAVFNIFMNLLFWLVLGYIVVAGWRSRLYGCRRTKLLSEIVFKSEV